MGLMDVLRRARGAPGEAARRGDTDTVREIVQRLDAMEPSRARFLAAFAYVLGRVAHADSHVSAEETASMERLVVARGHVPEDQAVLVVEIAKRQNQLFGGTENYLVTREFREVATREQRADLLECLFAVSAADASISTTEEAQIRLIANELGFSHEELVAMRSRFSAHRDVMKNLPGAEGLPPGPSRTPS